MQGRPRKRILFFAEAVTLAHLARVIALAESLDPAAFDVRIACHPRYRKWAECAGHPFEPLDGISQEAFRAALAGGKPVYDLSTLISYVEADRALISSFKPDLVVGDFRLSLAVSSSLEKVRYATVTNAYWSPCFSGDAFPIPVLPLTRMLPIPWAQALFDRVMPLAMASHCRPMNRLRARFGMPGVGNDLRRVYTDADFVLYADAEGLFPMRPLPASHRFLGPLQWSPPVAWPSGAGWLDFPQDVPAVYLTLGSSGSSTVAWRVVKALMDLPITLMVASAGAARPDWLPDKVRIADYLPGAEAAKRAAVVVCNGGSMTSQQALAAGKPVLGIASNMDQFLNMRALTDAGVGVLLRADRLDATLLQKSVMGILADVPLRDRAASRQAAGDGSDSPGRFAAWLAEALP